MALFAAAPPPLTIPPGGLICSNIPREPSARPRPRSGRPMVSSAAAASAPHPLSAVPYAHPRLRRHTGRSARGVTRGVDQRGSRAASGFVSFDGDVPAAIPPVRGGSLERPRPTGAPSGPGLSRPTRRPRYPSPSATVACPRVPAPPAGGDNSPLDALRKTRSESRPCSASPYLQRAARSLMLAP